MGRKLSYKVIRTTKESPERLSTVASGVVGVETAGSEIHSQGATLTIDPKKRYQKILGFGGAFTEAAAYTLSRVSKETRQKVLDAYFSADNGHRYNIGRVHIHSCDFALGNYTYIEDNDTSLESFSIDHDKELILPFVKDAEAVRGKAIDLLASPWSPPGWMKTTGEMNNGGKLKPRYQEVWARYFAKFLHAYKAEGLSMWGVTVQNEPDAVQVWDSCIYSAEEERDFVRDHLGPELNKQGLGEVKILIWDHNRDIIVERTNTVYSDPEAAQYIWGAGLHWYVSEEFEHLSQVHDRWPDKHILFTEGCQEGGVHLGSWDTGERYGRNIIGDMQNWNEGFLDWNLVLDETGGPNHVGNLCDAPIIVDTQKDELIFNSSYYYIGHFSRYIQPGAVRVGFDLNQNSDLQVLAVQNPDNSYAVVVMNETDQEKSCNISLGEESLEEQLSLLIPAHSISTVVIQ